MDSRKGEILFYRFSFIKSPQSKNIFDDKKVVKVRDIFSLHLDNTVYSPIVKRVLVYRTIDRFFFFFTPPALECMYNSCRLFQREREADAGRIDVSTKRIKPLEYRVLDSLLNYSSVDIGFQRVDVFAPTKSNASEYSMRSYTDVIQSGLRESYLLSR